MTSNRLPERGSASGLPTPVGVAGATDATIAQCAFCERLARGEALATNDLAAVLADLYPVSSGHVLVVPLRHESDYFSLLPAEREAILSLLAVAKAMLDEEQRPDGYNVGVNVGAAAGQTVAHAHVHLIPRYAGDVQDPRGGVRWVIPENAAYWRP